MFDGKNNVGYVESDILTALVESDVSKLLAPSCSSNWLINHATSRATFLAHDQVITKTETNDGYANGG